MIAVIVCIIDKYKVINACVQHQDTLMMESQPFVQSVTLLASPVTYKIYTVRPALIVPIGNSKPVIAPV